MLNDDHPENIYVSPTIAPAFTQSDPCQNQVVLAATPAGNYTTMVQKVAYFKRV